MAESRKRSMLAKLAFDYKSIGWVLCVECALWQELSMLAEIRKWSEYCEQKVLSIWRFRIMWGTLVRIRSRTFPCLCVGLVIS